MKKKSFLFFLSFFFLLTSVVLTSCDNNPSSGDNPPIEECTHEWGQWVTKEEATCSKEGTQERICSKCNEKEKSSLDKIEHKYSTATCTAGAICSVCGATSGASLGHNWIAADCDTPKTCSVCSATDGTALGHLWNTQKCDEVKECSRCDLIDSVLEDHSFENATINFTTIGACGGNASVKHCEACDYNLLLDYDLVCENFYPPINSQFTDGNGMLHVVETYICMECNLSFKTEVYEIEINECESNIHTIVSILNGTEEILNAEAIQVEFEHELEYSYTALGVNCTDGVIVNSSCENCDYTDENVIYEHISKEYLLNCPGVCDGFEYGYRKCEVCELKYNHYYNYGNCSMHSYDNYDECENCHIRLERQVISSEMSGCNVTDVINLTVFFNGNELISSVQYVNSEAHRTIYTGQKIGQSCEDGLIIQTVCLECEEAIGEPFEHYGHFYRDSNVDLSGYELCNDAQIIENKCIACNAIYDINICGCICDLISEENNIRIEQCTECGMIKKTYIEDGPRDEACNFIRTYTYELYLDDDLLYSGVEQEEMYQWHDVQYVYTLKNGATSCEEGVIVTCECTYCDYSEIDNEYFEHSILSTYHSIEGVCEASYYYGTCVCGQEGSFTFNHSQATEEYVENTVEGVTTYTKTYTCEECSIICIEEYYITTESKIETYHYTITLKDGENVLETFIFIDIHS